MKLLFWIPAIFSVLAHASVTIDPAKLPTTDGAVYGMFMQGDTLYMGGDFEHVGWKVGHGTAVDIETGQWLSKYQNTRPDDYVGTSVSDGQGGWYIGGLFKTVSGQSRSRIAHILADGSLDEALPDPDFRHIDSMALHGHQLIVSTSDYIALIDLETYEINKYDAVPDWWGDFYIGDFLVVGSKLYIAGDFLAKDSEGKNQRYPLRVFDLQTHEWEAPRFDLLGYGYSLEFDGTHVYLGGQMYDPAAKKPAGVFVLDARSGSIVRSIQSFYHWVRSIALVGDKLFAAGTIYTDSEKDAHYLIAYDLKTDRVLDWNPLVGNVEVRTLAVKGDTVFVGGKFETAGGLHRKNAFSLNARDLTMTNWNPNVGGDVYTISVSDKDVYLGGKFQLVGGEARHNLAAYDFKAARFLDWNPDAASVHQAGRVHTMVTYGNTMYLAGSFTTFGGQSRQSLAAVDVSSGRLTSWDPQAVSEYGDLEIRSLLVDGDRLYVGGNMGKVKGRDSNGLAAFNLAKGGQLLFWKTQDSSYWPLLAKWGNRLITSSGKTVSLINPSTGFTDVSYQTNEANHMVLKGDLLYLGSEDNVTELDLAKGTQRSFEPRGEDNYYNTYAMEYSGDSLFVGLYSGFMEIDVSLSQVIHQEAEWNESLGATHILQFGPYMIVSSEPGRYWGYNHVLDGGITIFDREKGVALR